jgi:hypothetical protein
MAVAEAHPVVGVWEVWANGAPFIHHVMMFNPEHTMLQSNPDCGNARSSDSIGMGVWRAEGDRVIGRFLETRADRNTHKGLGRSVIRFELHVYENEFTGRATTRIDDGSLAETSTATLLGRRFTD